MLTAVKALERVQSVFRNVPTSVGPGVSGRRRSGPGSPAAGVGVEHWVVVGNGMVGQRLLQRIVDSAGVPPRSLTVFGEEPNPALDRVNLTNYLGGTPAAQLQLVPREWYARHGIELHTGDPVVLIDRTERTVHSATGRVTRYDRLVLATGSSAHRPDVPGNRLPGVFVYRTLEDLERIRAHSRECRDVAVIGGGLLGLEAAEAFKQLGLVAHVIERGNGLLTRQLNPDGSRLLQRMIEAGGIRVHNARVTRAIEARAGGLTVLFADGTTLEVEMVVFATGIRPRDELARVCGLELGPHGGVKVNDRLQTSDPAIYAIGECASHNDTVYGLVLPGYEMAAVAARNLRGEAALFQGADQSAILKLNGIEVAAVGEFQSPGATYAVQREGFYRRVITVGGRVVGAIGVGDWPEQSRMRESIRLKRRVWPWQINRFEKHGRLWRVGPVRDVTQWPATAEVCNCLRINRGELSAACAGGCRTVEELAARTGASTVCGSCRPLLGQLVGQPMAVVAAKGWRTLLGASVLTALLAMVFFGYRIPATLTVQGGWKPDSLWTNGFIKQVTGFTLVGFAVLSLLLSLRKRFRKISFGDFGHWRAVHSVLGVLALVALVTHTGFHLGHNLNRILMLNFLALAFFGSLAGAVTALEARLSGPAARRLRSAWTLTHVLLFWPLPVLIFFHALKTYYY